MLRRNDFILILCVILIAGILLIIFAIARDETAHEVIIQVDGEVYETLSLTEDQVLQINDTNTFEIAEGQGRMVQADCPDQLCIHQSPIDRNQQSIVCLPNRVVITVESDLEDDVDSIAH